MWASLARGVVDEAHGDPARGGRRLRRRRSAPRARAAIRSAPLVAWFARTTSSALRGVGARALRAAPSDARRRSSRSPGTLGWRAVAELEDWSSAEVFDKRRDAPATPTTRWSCSASGARAASRIAGPFGHGGAADRRRSFAAEKPGPWPPSWPADPCAGPSRTCCTVEQTAASPRPTSRCEDGVFYAQSFFTTRGDRELIVAVQGAVEVWVDDAPVLERVARRVGRRGSASARTSSVATGATACSRACIADAASVRLLEPRRHAGGRRDRRRHARRRTRRRRRASSPTRTRSTRSCARASTPATRSPPARPVDVGARRRTPRTSTQLDDVALVARSIRSSSPRTRRRAALEMAGARTRAATPRFPDDVARAREKDLRSARARGATRGSGSRAWLILDDAEQRGPAEAVEPLRAARERVPERAGGARAARAPLRAARLAWRADARPRRSRAALPRRRATRSALVPRGARRGRAARGGRQGRRAHQEARPRRGGRSRSRARAPRLEGRRSPSSIASRSGAPTARRSRRASPTSSRARATRARRRSSSRRRSRRTRSTRRRASASPTALREGRHRARCGARSRTRSQAGAKADELRDGDRSPRRRDRPRAVPQGRAQAIIREFEAWEKDGQPHGRHRRARPRLLGALGPPRRLERHARARDPEHPVAGGDRRESRAAAADRPRPAPARHQARRAHPRAGAGRGQADADDAAPRGRRLHRDRAHHAASRATARRGARTAGRAGSSARPTRATGGASSSSSRPKDKKLEIEARGNVPAAGRARRRRDLRRATVARRRLSPPAPEEPDSPRRTEFLPSVRIGWGVTLDDTVARFVDLAQDTPRSTRASARARPRSSPASPRRSTTSAPARSTAGCSSTSRTARRRTGAASSSAKRLAAERVPAPDARARDPDRARRS